MTLIIPCARCGGRFLSMAELEAHRCDDVRRKMPELRDVRQRFQSAWTLAANHAGSAIDHAIRMLLLLFAFIFLGLGRYLNNCERELTTSRMDSPSVPALESLPGGKLRERSRRINRINFSEGVQ
jgi:hypothetical protein